MRTVVYLLALTVVVGSCAGVESDPGLECDPPLSECGGACVNTDTDDANCGSCGNACMEGMECDGSGMCIASCDPGLTPCSGACVNTDTDDANCGSCGNACMGGMECDGSGMCAVACLPGNVRCNGNCINPQTEPMFCGATLDCQGANAGRVCEGVTECEDGACKAIYSSLFTSGVSSTAQQCNEWESLRDGLTDTYSSVMFFGTQNSTGYTCAEPAAVAQIVEGLRTRTDFILDCDGNNWQLCTRTLEDEFWVNGTTLCNTTNCSGGGTMLRPCRTAAGQWGGVDTNFCDGPTQTITVEFIQ